MENEKANKNFEDERKQFRGILDLEARYKPSKWNALKDFVTVFFIACFFLLIGAIVLFLIITLIENPLSLAIICGTILLMWFWGNR